jgi:hypothetical protein
MRRVAVAVLAVGGCRCGESSPPKHDHAPVDPELGIAIVVPPSFAGTPQFVVNA